MRAFLAFLAAVPARSLHSTPPPRRRTSQLHATEWQAALDDIDGDAWRDLRRELYGAPDAAPPSTLARFETYCENRRKSLEEEVLEDLDGRRLLECQQNYPDLEARPIWDVATEAWRWLIFQAPARAVTTFHIKTLAGIPDHLMLLILLCSP